MAVASALLAGCGGSGGTTSGMVGNSALTPPPIANPAPVAPAPAPVIRYAQLTWKAPTQNEDGTALTSLAGYKVRYGQSATELTETLDVANPGATTVRIDGLAAGTWFFTLAAYTNTGFESAQTPSVSKTILQ
jgi:hypothetical protein